MFLEETLFNFSFHFLVTISRSPLCLSVYYWLIIPKNVILEEIESAITMGSSFIVWCRIPVFISR